MIIEDTLPDDVNLKLIYSQVLFYPIRVNQRYNCICLTAVGIRFSYVSKTLISRT